MKRAYCLVFPSVWYEAFGMTIIEAFSCGVPVVAAQIGAAAELVDVGRTGLCFAPGDAADLAQRVREAFARPADMAEMGKHAREEYELKYTPSASYNCLMAIYESLVKRATRTESAPHAAHLSASVPPLAPSDIEGSSYKETGPHIIPGDPLSA
jgi:glycosyltransferase involved in cell wall biosynthesis